MKMAGRCGGKIISLTPFLAAWATVFIVSPDLGNSLVSGKQFWFYGSMGLIAIATMISAFLSRKPLQFGWIDGLVLLYGAVALLSSVFLNQSEVAAKHILFLLVVLLYFYFRFLWQTNQSARYWLTLGFILTGLIESVWGLLQLFDFATSQHNLFRMTGSFFNPGPFACYVATVVPAALYFALRDRRCLSVKFRLRYWAVYLRWTVAALTVAASVIALPAAMSRAAWLAAVGGCGIIAFCQLRIKNYKLRGIRFRLAGFVVLAILAAGCAGMYYLKKDSADGRAFIWKNTLTMIMQNPQGAGIGRFSGAYGNVQAACFESGQGSDTEKHVAGNPEYAFNEYLQIAAEQGLLPFTLFIGVIAISLYNGFKRKKTASVASLIALLIAAFASYPFSVLPFLIALAFLLASANSRNFVSRHTVKSGAIAKLAATAFAVCGLATVSLCLCNRYPTYDAHKKWKRAERLYQTGAFAEAAERYSPLSPHLSDQIIFLFEYAQSLAKSEQYEASNEILHRAQRISCDPMLHNIMGKNFQFMKQYVEAERCFRKSAHLVPSRVYPYYLLALLYQETGERDKAIAAAQTALAKEPKVQSTAVREIRTEMNKLLGNVQ